jgi:hypothetical protein
MNISWKEYCSWLERLAARKLLEMQPVYVESILDETPLAGYFEIGMHRFGGKRHSWIRFRERPEGVFFQIDDAAWRPMPGLDPRAAGEVLEDFLLGFERQRGGYSPAALEFGSPADGAAPPGHWHSRALERSGS